MIVLPSLLAGCTPAPAAWPTNDASAFGNPPGSSSTPTATCTPLTGGGAPYRCNQTDHDALQAQAAEYASAEKVYRAYFALENKQIRSGTPVTDEMLAVLAGPMVTAYTKVALDQHDAGWRADRDAVLGYVRMSDVAPYQGSTIALDTCEDGSAVNAMDGATPVMKLQIVKGHAYLTKIDGAYKIWWTDGQVVTSC